MNRREYLKSILDGVNNNVFPSVSTVPVPGGVLVAAEYAFGVSAVATRRKR